MTIKSGINSYINHIVFVIDASGSMSGLSNEVVKVFDGQIKNLAKRSQELDQETRVSVYLFSDTVQCLIYDKDVLRLPSLKSFYRASGGTALIDGTLKALEDLAKTPELYGDHAFLTYVLTDGEENQSRSSTATMAAKLKALPDNWTVAVLVPGATSVHEVKKFGFPANNVQVWSTDSAGINEVGNVISQTTDNFMRARATGVRGTKNLFNVDVSKLSTSAVSSNLQELSPSEYVILPVRQDAVIKEYVESWIKGGYRQGSAYYELMKKEIIGAGKQLAIQNKKNGKIYSGLNARGVLGLPTHEIKVAPADFGEWNIFVQSTSTNRKLIKGTTLLVLN